MSKPDHRSRPLYPMLKAALPAGTSAGLISGRTNDGSQTLELVPDLRSGKAQAIDLRVEVVLPI